MSLAFRNGHGLCNISAWDSTIIVKQTTLTLVAYQSIFFSFAVASPSLYTLSCVQPPLMLGYHHDDESMPEARSVASTATGCELRRPGKAPLPGRTRR
jgi:hypothetical protein